MTPHRERRPGGNGTPSESVGEGQQTDVILPAGGDSPADATQLDVFALVDTNVYEPHRRRFREIIELLAGEGVPFTCDDVVAIMGHDCLGSSGAHGALFRQAAADGLIVAHGFTTSRRTGGIVRVWRGAP